ncbi:MAG: T9SS type A sorting domain-containing protein, partial [Candidatus Cloacimonetes bacterium]|nr:T9SS type A sorting domain-containing protein [Candidatus Cloacimonadota bacterium]
AQSSDLIAGVRFKSPLDQDEGEIYAQLWQDDYLISEIEITEFSQGEWLETILPVMVIPDPEKNYYVGYKIHSINGKLAYHDNGPQQAGKGAFFRMSGWTALPAAVNDFNFCIEAIFASQEFATVTGQIVLDGGEGNILDVAVKAGNYITHPDPSGNYLLDLKADDYLLTASLNDYNSASIDLSLDWDELLDDQNLTLTYGVAYEDDVIGLNTHLKANYPNPFNPETRIGFSLFGEKRPVTLAVYNLKGELVKTLINAELEAGDWEFVWNGADQLNRPVSSGLYLYRLDTGDFSSTRKMLLLK